jgi:predicted Zn-dependent protease
MLLLPAVAGCATSPATGETFFTGGLTPEQEKKLGAEQHPKMVEQFGGAYDDKAIQDYVQSVGTLLAKTSEQPNLDWTFTVLDSPIVNAFALPGGYVYITRGLMALADNEAQVAGVLGHEIGHVTARHSAQRYGGSVLATAASIAAGIFLGGDAAQAAGALSQVALSSYSRSQEFEADQLGVRYVARAGYGPDAMAGFLEKMEAESRLQATLRGDPDAADRFSLLQTHPRTAERVREAIAAANVKTVANPMVARDIYLRKIDGLLFGYSADEGFVRGRRFIHPKLGFAFEMPEGFRLFNASTQVVAMGPEDSVIVFDQAGKDANNDPLRYLTEQWARNSRLEEAERIDINGMPAATGRTTARTQKGTRDLRAVAIRYDSGKMYRFLFVTPPDLTGRLGEELRRTTYSFRKLSSREANEVQPHRLRIHTVKAGETQESLAQRMPYPDYRLLRFRVLNGLSENDRLQPGNRVKLVQ